MNLTKHPLLDNDIEDTGFLTIGDFVGLSGMSGVITIQNTQTLETITGEADNVWEIAVGRDGEWRLIEEAPKPLTTVTPAAPAAAPAPAAAAAPEGPSFFEKLLDPELLMAILAPPAAVTVPRPIAIQSAAPAKAGMSPGLINGLIIGGSVLGVGAIIWALAASGKG